MFRDPLGQYNFDIPPGWAYNKERSHLITVIFNRPDRLSERLVIRMLPPTVVPDAGDEEWYTHAKDRYYRREQHPIPRLLCGEYPALFGGWYQPDPEQEPLLSLVLRGGWLDLLLQHLDPEGPPEDQLSPALHLLCRSLVVPVKAAPRFHKAEEVYPILERARIAALEENWENVSKEARLAQALARETYLASVTGKATFPEVPAVMAVIDALILQVQAGADLQALRDATLLVFRARHTVRELPLSGRRKREVLNKLEEHLDGLYNLQKTLIRNIGGRGVEEHPLPEMHRAAFAEEQAAVAFERGDLGSGLAFSQMAVDDILQVQVQILETPETFASRIPSSLQDKLTSAGAASPEKQAALAKVIINRFLITQLGSAFRLLLTLQRTAGETRRARETGALLLRIARSLDAPKISGADFPLMPMEGHRRHLAVTLLELAESYVFGGEPFEAEGLNWYLHEAALMIEELKGDSLLQSRQRLLAGLLEGLSQRETASSLQLENFLAKQLTSESLQTLAAWALGDPPTDPTFPRELPPLPEQVLAGGPAAVIRWGLEEKPESQAAAFWHLTSGEDGEDSRAAAQRTLNSWLKADDWRQGWAASALRALDPTLPLDGWGRLPGLEYARACLVQPVVLIQYDLKRSLATKPINTSSALSTPPTPENSPFGEPVVKEVLEILDLIVTAQESQPNRLHKLLEDLAMTAHPEFARILAIAKQMPPGSLFRSAIGRGGTGSALSLHLRAEYEALEERGEISRLADLNGPMIWVAARYGTTSDWLQAVGRVASTTSRQPESGDVTGVIEHLRLAAYELGDARLEADVQHALALVLRGFSRRGPGLLESVFAFQRAVTLREQLGEPVAAAGALIDLSALLIAFQGILEKKEETRDYALLANQYLTAAMAYLTTGEPTPLQLRYLGEAFQNRARFYLAAKDAGAAVEDAARSMSLAKAIGFQNLAVRALETYRLASKDSNAQPTDLPIPKRVIEEIRLQRSQEDGASNREGFVTTVLGTLSDQAGKLIPPDRAAALLVREVEIARGYTYNRWLGVTPDWDLSGLEQEQKEDPTRPVIALYIVTRDRINLIFLEEDRPANLVSIRMSHQELRRIVQDHLSGLIKQGRLRGVLPWKRFQSSFMEEGCRLVAPLEPYIAAGRTICLIPHRDIHRLALHTLSTEPEGEAIGLRTPVFTNPSLANWRVARKNIRRPSAGAFIGATAPQTELANFSETKELEGMLAEVGLIVRRPAPNRVDMKALAAPKTDWRVLHLASHGVFEPSRQEIGLLLAQEGVLPPPPTQMVDASIRRHLVGPHALRKVNPTARLVFLASCVSSQNVAYPGDDLMGMTRAWFASGASDLIAGSWTVISTTVSAFTKAFYTRLIKGQTVAEAVLAGRRSAAKAYPDPFFWGVFLHQGANAASLIN